MPLFSIVLINPPFARYGGVRGHGGKSAPLNLAYLAAIVRRERSDIKVSIIDAEGLDMRLDELCRQVAERKPDLIGITCPTPAFYIIQELCLALKEQQPDATLILGGPHPTALPEQSLVETQSDVVVIGEGELTFLELVENLITGKALDDVAGLAFIKDGKFIQTTGRELITDLDMLPFPAKDLLPLEQYYLPPTKRIREGKATNMLTSRGCPYPCTFCNARAFWGKKTRIRSIPNVLDEIQECVEVYELTEFSFHDELFTLRKDRVMEMCQGILDRKLDISWTCMARSGSVNPKLLAAMKKAGCGKIGFGFESGNQGMLEHMKKKESLENGLRSVRFCQETGIDVAGAFILGHPGETEETIKDTIRFAIELNVDSAAFFIAIPYPGTELYDMAIQNGYIRKDFTWDMFAPVSNLESPMVIPTMTPAELDYWKKKAFRSFYLRPSYLGRQLGKIRSIADAMNLLRGFQTFLKIT